MLCCKQRIAPLKNFPDERAPGAEPLLSTQPPGRAHHAHLHRQAQQASHPPWPGGFRIPTNETAILALSKQPTFFGQVVGAAEARNAGADHHHIRADVLQRGAAQQRTRPPCWAAVCTCSTLVHSTKAYLDCSTEPCSHTCVLPPSPPLAPLPHLLQRRVLDV